MTSYAAAVLDVVTLCQTCYLTLYNNLALSSFEYPSQCTFTNESSFDMIIVGGGTAGSIMATRLAETGKYSVLLIENGGNPPSESEYLGLFPIMVNSVHDYNMTSTNKNFSALVNGALPISAGKMLGGSSMLNHGIMVVPPEHDFDYYWVNETGDDNWNYTNFIEFFKRTTKLVDTELLNSTYASRYGDSGPTLLARETQNLTALFGALAEAGHTVDIDLPSNLYKGYVQPIFNNVNTRQGTANSYLSTVKTCSKLCVTKNTHVDKILINGTRAYGVQMTTSSGESYVVYANKEVVLTAGCIFTPQLLMLSGIGPKEDLEALGIDVILDLPVGQKMRDHTSTMLVYRMESSTETAPATNPSPFPTSCATGYQSVDSSQTYPDSQSIMLGFYPSQTSQLQLTRQSFQMLDSICDEFYTASIGYKMIYNVFNLMHPKSTGKVCLNSTDPTDYPLIYSGHLTNSEDKDLMVSSIDSFHESLFNTTYFKEINATWINLGYNNTEDFVTNCTMGMWHCSGTAPLGSVLNTTTMSVKGLDNLRVADASAMPQLVTGNIGMTVRALGERCAHIIIETYSGSSSS